MRRPEAVFGAFDGSVSVVGVIFGLLVHHAPASSIAVAGVGGAIASSVSMGVGEYESSDGPGRLSRALAMLGATILGSLVPLWGFFVFATPLALVVAGLGCAAVAASIGHLKANGVRGYASSLGTLALALGLTLGIVSLIPGSV